MKIKRFFSHNMRNVIRMVREELGADAVILSNSRVNGGVEVIAAVDYDEALFEKDQANKKSDYFEYSLGEAPEGKQEKLNESSGEVKINHFATSLSQPLFDVASKSLDKAGSVTDSIDKELPGSSPTIITSLEKNPFESTVSRISQRADTHKKDHDSADFKFTLLDDSFSQEINSDKGIDGAFKFDKVNVSDTLFEPPVRDNPVVHNESSEHETSSRSVWSQEPTLVEMRNEIKTLRGLVEQQLTGLAWGDMARRNPVRAKLIRQLLQLDISPVLSQKIVDALASSSSNYETAWPNALSFFANQLPIYNGDITVTGGIVAVLGATGVGKTTTIAKMAARYALRQGRNKLALVTTDSFRIAAHEQLRTYGRILDIPVRVAKEKSELTDILMSFSDKELVLIDTAGMGQRDIRLSEQFALLEDSVPKIKVFIALSATTHRAGLEEIVKAFSGVQLHGCILTKIDETTSLGGALSVALLNNLPIAYVSDGQKVPEDFHLARAYNLISRAVSIADQVDEPLQAEAVELAFNGMLTNVGI
ncbi:MAG: flagellar biosynthesis protein FlhF [Gammaproteobacteria bacterium]|nr:flagellar biosynthesis protein FlhF [Gammaproteobacteria bacterium]